MNDNRCSYCHTYDCDIDHVKAVAEHTCISCHVILSDSETVKCSHCRYEELPESFRTPKTRTPVHKRVMVSETK